MTIIEIRPFRNGWKCFEAPGGFPTASALAYGRGGGVGRGDVGDGNGVR